MLRSWSQAARLSSAYPTPVLGPERCVPLAALGVPIVRGHRRRPRACPKEKPSSNELAGLPVCLKSSERDQR